MPEVKALVTPARPISHSGARLRRLRLLRGMKQSHLAELAGVTQTTVSRWESGAVQADPEVVARLMGRLAGRQSCDCGRPLRRLVEMAARPVHLIDDVGHRLLAASRAREREWGVAANELLGTSLWPHATDDIRAAEERWTGSGPYAEVTTRAGTHGKLRIHAGTMIWERLDLDDGWVARLCTSIATVHDSCVGDRPSAA